MGNNNSNVLDCCVTQPNALLKIVGKDYIKKEKSSSGKSEITAATAISSLQKKEVLPDEYSFSSISSKSSHTISLDNDCYYPPDEMRNDTDAVEWNHSLSGHELRVAESRYDEAITDAVNCYYGDERYHNTYGGLRDETQEMRE